MKTSMEKAFMIIPRGMVSHLDEALALSETAGYRVARVWKTRHPRRIGKGLIEEVARSVEGDGVEVVIFYGDLQPSSRFNLMKRAGVRVIDRVMLILEIFAKHAGSREAKLQIEMARISHEIPMVREMIRRSKMGELPGFLGPGGYAIDSYYRHLTRRLARLRRELEDLRRLRRERFKGRSREGFRHVAIVGYASAGKTSLFNRLTGEDKPVGPEYFTTLHPKHKAVDRGWGRIVFVDTVGFIRDLPPEVVEAFYSTLEEIVRADAAIFVIDVSEPLSYIEDRITAGMETLGRIGAHGLPIIVAANKIDLLPPGELESRLSRISLIAGRYPNTTPGVVPISALTGEGVEELVERVIGVLSDGGRRAWRVIR